MKYLGTVLAVLILAAWINPDEAGKIAGKFVSAFETASSLTCGARP